MPRPRKWRRVCSLPDVNRFGPLDFAVEKEHVVIMSVDEYETIRLIDLEGLSQEECASLSMWQELPSKYLLGARKKIAESLVNGKVLRIEGGDYKLCDGEGDFHSTRCCHRNRCGKAKL